MENEVIIIPAYNSQKTINELISSLSNYNTIVVDDGSADDTYKEAKKATHIIRHSQNMGVGASIKSAVKYALEKKYTKAITIDSDGQHSVKKVNQFFEKLSGTELIIGNRFHSKNDLPFQKVSSNFFGNIIFNKVFGTNIMDISCGFRAFNLTDNIINIKSNGYDFLYEFLIYSIELNTRIDYIDISCRYYYNDFLSTKYEEAISFFSTITKYLGNVDESLRKKITETYQSILDLRNFTIQISEYTFYGFYISNYHSYVIQTDIRKAHKYYSFLRGK